MAFNIEVTGNHPDAVKFRIEYQRIDNTVNPAWVTINPDPAALPYEIVGLPEGQYRVRTTPILANGKECDPNVRVTGLCPKPLAFNAQLKYDDPVNFANGYILVSYALVQNADKIRIRVEYPNGSIDDQKYDNDGISKKIALPANVLGDIKVRGGTVCHDLTSWQSKLNDGVNLTIDPPSNSSLRNNMTLDSGAFYIYVDDKLISSGGNLAPGAIFNFYVPNQNGKTVFITFDNAQINNGTLVSNNVNYPGTVSPQANRVTFTPVDIVNGVAVTLTNAPTFVEMSNQGVPGATRTQVFKAAGVAPGVSFRLEVYSHPVVVVCDSDDTVADMIGKMIIAINATSEADWNSSASAPAHGTPGFPPAASLVPGESDRIKVVLDYVHQFAADAF
jgi:hypothetical protein